MGKLEVIFRIRLAFPSICVAGSVPPAVLKFAETGNTVYVEAPQYGTTPADGPSWENSLMTLRVEHECTEGEAKAFHHYSGSLGIERDAARAFCQLFESIRESASRRDNTVFTYPVVPSETLLTNPLVAGYEFEKVYDGKRLEQARQNRGIPAIEIRGDWWADAVAKLGENKPVPVHKRFAMDAFYFADHDPPVGIIMACAAWETALRYYLSNIASKKDGAYQVASDMRGVATLEKFATEARGGLLFDDWIAQTKSARDVPETERKFLLLTLEGHKQLMKKLPRARNTLLHSGKMESSGRSASDYALAVSAAIDWLFADGEPRP